MPVEDMIPCRVKVECINWLAGENYARARVSVRNQAGNTLSWTEHPTWAEAVQKANRMSATLFELRVAAAAAKFRG